MLGKAQFVMRCEAVVREFVSDRNGLIMVMSQDPHFTTHLRNAITKHLELGAGCVRNFVNSERLAQELAETRTLDRPVLLLMECTIGGGCSVEVFKEMRRAMPEMLAVVLTTEIERDRLALFVDEGARNCITKPISANNLVEKLASTICPNLDLSKLIDDGKKHLAALEYSAALQRADQVLEIKPESPMGLMIRGDALKGLGDRDSALDSYLRASELAEMYLEPLKKLAQFFQEEGDLDQELDYLVQLDQLSPLNVDRKLRMGVVRLAMERRDDAKATFDLAMDLSRRRSHGIGNGASGVAMRIGEMLTKHDAALAEHYLRESLTLRGNRLTKADVPTFNALGMAMRRQNKWREAIANYQQALSIAPDEATLHYNLALSFMQGDKSMDAARHMDRALALDPALTATSAAVATNVGVALQRVGRREEAIQYAKHALKLAPGNQPAMQLLQALTKNSAAA